MEKKCWKELKQKKKKKGDVVSNRVEQYLHICVSASESNNTSCHRIGSVTAAKRRLTSSLRESRLGRHLFFKFKFSHIDRVKTHTGGLDRSSNRVVVVVVVNIVRREVNYVNSSTSQVG